MLKPSLGGDMSRLSDLHTRLIKEQTHKEICVKRVDELAQKLCVVGKRNEYALQARVLMQQAAKETQSLLEHEISNIVTLAIQSVFDEPYEFIARFVERRNKTECDLLFLLEGQEVDPMESSGGGLLDVASLALRIAFWNLNRTSPVFILDEPLKWLSVDMHHKASAMFKMLSDKLGIQFIIVSHLEDLKESADRVFTVKKGKIASVI